MNEPKEDLLMKINKDSIFTRNQNKDIQILRGIAIMYVLLEHILGICDTRFCKIINSEWFSFWGGVDLFFSVSGFVIISSVKESINKHTTGSM
ncbi:MAG: hypothetical protein QW522_00865, partial [Candidatus Methanomethyliaceae archaeon]